MARRDIRAAMAVLAVVLLAFPLVPVAAGASAFNDGFDRPNSTDLGPGWLEVVDGLSISGNQLSSAPTKKLFQLAVVPAFSSADQTVGAGFATASSNSLPRFGVVLRYQDAMNYYLVSRLAGGTSALRISKVVGGTETVLKSLAVANPPSNTIFRLEGQATGTGLSLRLDGVLKLTVVDGTFSAGSVGIGLGSLGIPGSVHRADDFAASGADGTTALTLTLGATPGNVPVNGSATISWSTTGAIDCTFTSGLSGTRPVSGSEATGPLTSSTSFDMTCTSDSGGSISKSVTVTVDPPPGLTLALGAAPADVPPNGASTITWSTTGATDCSFTAGLSGSRPVSGSEGTGPLASSTSFDMTCTSDSGGSVSKSVTVTVGSPPAALPTAAQVHATATMVLPPSVRSFVFLVPNEAHHQEIQRLISPTNGYLLPMNVTLPAGATVSVVSGDYGHSHTLRIDNATPQYTTGALAYGDLSLPVTLAPGNHDLIDTAYPWMHGRISVNAGAPSYGTLLVGGFFVPENRIADYRSRFAASGFTIESEHLFQGGGKKHWLVIFSTNEDLSVAGPKLQVLVRANSYG